MMFRVLRESRGIINSMSIRSGAQEMEGNQVDRWEVRCIWSASAGMCKGEL